MNQRTAFYEDDVIFQGKLDGTVQKFTIDTTTHHAPGEDILDGNGDPVDAARIVYPTWDPMIGLTAAKETYRAHRQAIVTTDELGDIVPQPALPIAYGDEEEDEPAYGDLDPEGEELGSIAYAARERRQAAQRAHVRTALKDFSAAEKEALIEEGDGGLRATHLLDVTGTHYQGMLADAEEPEWAWGL